MKKLVLGLSLFGATSLFADYQLTLIDKYGVETNQCIKSYSFSNNLESLARKKSNIDEYSSTKEVLTNKIWDGKPVYRRVFKDIMGFNQDGVHNNWRIIPFHNENDNVEKVILGEIDFNNIHEHYTYYHDTYSQFRYKILPYGISYVNAHRNGTDFVNSNTKATVVLEYTKTTDTASSPSNTFKSYLHYVPSSSTTNDVTTIDLKNTGVRFLEGYTYDYSTDSCIKN